METIFGITPKDGGTVRLKGKTVDIPNTKQAIEHKLAMVTEDRLHTGVISIQPVRVNASLAYLRSITRGGLLNRKKEQEDTDRMAQRLSIKGAFHEQCHCLLSGGNQQK